MSKPRMTLPVARPIRMTSDPSVNQRAAHSPLDEPHVRSSGSRSRVNTTPSSVASRFQTSRPTSMRPGRPSGSCRRWHRSGGLTDGASSSGTLGFAVGRGAGSAGGVRSVSVRASSPTPVVRASTTATTAALTAPYCRRRRAARMRACTSSSRVSGRPSTVEARSARTLEVFGVHDRLLSSTAGSRAASSLSFASAFAHWLFTVPTEQPSSRAVSASLRSSR